MGYAGQVECSGPVILWQFCQPVLLFLTSHKTLSIASVQ